MTATVEAVVEQLDLAPIILTERINPTIGRVVPLPDSERGNRRSKYIIYFLSIYYIQFFFP